MTGDSAEAIPAPTPREAATWQRWREREVASRLLARGDAAAPAFVIHGGPPSTIARDDVRSPVVRIAADVIARHRAMCGVPVARVIGCAGDRDRLDVERSLATRLGCLPDDEVYGMTDPAYVDSVWWALGQLWQAGMLRETFREALWCPRCAAPVDEPVRDVQRDATAALVRFPVVGDNALQLTGASLLVDVADPSTLPAVTAVRVDPAADYVLAQSYGDDYPVVTARSTVALLLGTAATIHRDVAVDELLGVPYRPPTGRRDDHPLRWHVVVDVAGTAADARSGLAPVAPGCGGEDLQIARDHDLAIVDPFAPDGWLATGVGRDGAGDLDEVGRTIVATLRAQGLVVRTAERTWSVHGCPACDGAIVGRVRPTWVFTTNRPGDETATGAGDVERSAGDRDDGRTEVEGAGWRASSDDVDGIPLPLWRCGPCRHVNAIDSRAALSTLSGRDLADRDLAAAAAGISIRCQRCGDGVARWVGQAVDTLVAAAVAPFARFGFPALPGSDVDVAHRCHVDLLIDGSPRAGRWATAVSTMSRLVWNAESFDAALHVGARRGVGDDAAPVPLPLAATWFDLHGADAVRWAVLTGQGHSDDDGAAAAERRLRNLRDACDEHVAAAAVDGWRPFEDDTSPDIDGRDVIDRWVLAELADTVAGVRERLERFELTGAGRRIQAFVQDLCDWYLPRARAPRPMMGGTSRPPRTSTHATLHECLVTVAALLAPFAPFISDELYERLVRAGDPTAPDSVHLLRYPTVDPTARNDSLRDAMVTARRIVATGHRGRRRAGIGPDHTVPGATVTAPADIGPYWSVLAPAIADELGVERIELAASNPSDTDSALPGRWHVTRDGDTTVALWLTEAVPRGDRSPPQTVVPEVVAR